MDTGNRSPSNQSGLTGSAASSSASEFPAINVARRANILESSPDEVSSVSYLALTALPHCYLSSTSGATIHRAHQQVSPFLLPLQYTSPLRQVNNAETGSHNKVIIGIDEICTGKRNPSSDDPRVWTASGTSRMRRRINPLVFLRMTDDLGIMSIIKGQNDARGPLRQGDS